MDADYKLVIDIGNTRIKLAVFKDGLPAEIFVTGDNLTGEISNLVKKFGVPGSCIISRVQMNDDEILSLLKPISGSKLIFLNTDLKLPVKILYKTPQTLGNDRLANACAAWTMNPGKNTVVVD